MSKAYQALYDAWAAELRERIDFAANRSNARRHK